MMGGLEKITGAIISKAELEASKTIEKAQKQAEEILNKAKLEAENKIKNEQMLLNEECERILQMGKAGDRQEIRQIALASKSKVIFEIIEEAKNKIKNLGIREYTTVLERLIEKFAEEKKGEILFSETDKKAAEVIKALLKEKNLELSGETASCDRGFVIRYGKIEINCSIDSVFEEKYSELTDLVNSVITE